MGSTKLETVKVTGKTMIKALEYLQDLGYNEPDMIRVTDTLAKPRPAG